MAKNLTSEEKEAILRLRKIRDHLDYSQEKFADVLDVSISSYKKIESYENRISLSVLKKIKRNLGVSADYILDGDAKAVDDIWEAILNCSEEDKMHMLLRLYHYFVNNKKSIFPTNDHQFKNFDRVLAYANELQKVENEDDA